MNDAPPVLIAEDDAKVAALLANYLQAQGWATRCVGDGTQVLEALHAGPFSVLLLDLMLPGLDGLEVCRRLRRFCAVPVIMLTARVDEIDRLLGLEAGADDYVCKPFSPRELAARVKAQWRRVSGGLTQGASADAPGGFEIHDAAQRVMWQGQAVDLTVSEFRLLRALMARPGAVLSRAQLLDALHPGFRDTADRTVDSHVRNLRRKLAALRPLGSGISAVYGTGYRFES
jgi:two-component system, OmpR family, response regulator BaeR